MASLLFTDDVTSDRSNKMSSEINRAMFSAYIQPNAAKLRVLMDNDPKHIAKATQEFFTAKKWNIFQWPRQSLDLNQIEQLFRRPN